MDVPSSGTRYLFLQITCGKTRAWNPLHFSKAALTINDSLVGTYSSNSFQIDILFVVPKNRLDGGFDVKLKNTVNAGDFEALEGLDPRWNSTTYADRFLSFELPNTDIFC